VAARNGLEPRRSDFGTSAARSLRAHLRWIGNAVVVGSAACPSATVTPTPTRTPPAKITICHRSASAKNPYRRITISSRAVSNQNSASGQVLRGHMRHTGDLLLPGASPCPSGTGTTSQGVKLSANLQPVSGASGSGTATVTTRINKGELCYTLTVSGLTDVNGAHIHRGSTGDIVVPLTAPTTGTSGGCVSVAKPLLQEIVSDPGAFYVSVHTPDVPERTGPGRSHQIRRTLAIRSGANRARGAGRSGKGGARRGHTRRR